MFCVRFCWVVFFCVCFLFAVFWIVEMNCIFLALFVRPLLVYPFLFVCVSVSLFLRLSVRLFWPCLAFSGYLYCSFVRSFVFPFVNIFLCYVLFIKSLVFVRRFLCSFIRCCCCCCCCFFCSSVRQLGHRPHPCQRRHAKTVPPSGGGEGAVQPRPGRDSRTLAGAAAGPVD